MRERDGVRQIERGMNGFSDCSLFTGQPHFCACEAHVHIRNVRSLTRKVVVSGCVGVSVDALCDTWFACARAMYW